MLTGLAGLTALSGIMGESAPVAPAPPVVPTLNLQGWWKADAGIIKEGDIPATADGDAVYQWQDSGPAGNYLAQGTLANRPTLKLNIQNGLPVVRFDGVDDYMQRSFTRNRPSTFFAVFRKSASGSRYVVDGDNNILALLSPDEASVQAYNGAAFNAACTPGNWIAVSVVWNGATSKVSVNGAMPTVGDSGLTGGATVFNLGRRGSGASFWQGDIGEVLQYSGAMADVDRETVEDYLIARWNISAAPPPFAPTDIVGLQAWYKADGTRWQDSARTVVAVADADPVGAWDDYSGNSRHILQTTAAARPTLKLAIQNGLPVLRFDGVDDRLLLATLAMGSDAVSVFLVAKLTTAGNYAHFLAYGAAGAGDWNLRQIATTGRLALVSGTPGIGAGASAAAGTPSGTTANLVGQGFKLLEGGISVGNFWELWENGVSKDSMTTAFTQAASAAFTLGSQGASLYLNGDIAEVLIYNALLSTTDRQAVENYLMTKWGITAPPFTPTSIPGLQAWYKADGARWQDSARTVVAVADADPVGALDDYSGNSRHLLQATAAKRPTLKLAIQNGLPVIRFDGVDDGMQVLFTLNQPHTRFAVVVNRSAQAGACIMIDGAAADSAYAMWNPTDTPRAYAGTYLIGNTASGTAWHIWRETFNGATSKIGIDSGAVVTANAGATNAGGVTLGGRGGPTPGFWTNCDIAEVLEYDTALSDTDVTSVINYLASKWGITL